MSKRKHPEDVPEIELYGLEDLTSRLQEGGGRSGVARASLAIAYLGRLTIPDLQSYNETAPSFNQARWEKIAPQVWSGCHQRHDAT
jgi:hypothetical protein